MFSSSVENAILIQKKRSEREEKIKLVILELIINKIQYYSKLGQLECIYKIPNFLFGYAPYDLSIISKYLIKKLKLDGFYIIKINTEYIYISWDITKLGKKEPEKIDTNYSAFKNNNKSR